MRSPAIAARQAELPDHQRGQQAARRSARQLDAGRLRHPGVALGVERLSRPVASEQQLLRARVSGNRSTLLSALVI